MSIIKFFKKGKEVTTTVTKTTTVVTKEEIVKDSNKSEDSDFSKIAPKDYGKLDMVIAFDTTGSMSSYIEAVRSEVSDLIPQLFTDNDDLRLGIVAFGDYCDMLSPTNFGYAYQSVPLTDNENDLVKFVRQAKNTGGGDGPEFYELVIKKIVEETNWREGSNRIILLIADSMPHELGYTFRDFVIGNQIDWRHEAKKAADMGIKIDTVTIHDLPWYKELSEMTNGVSVPFKTSSKTADLVRASVMSSGSVESRLKFDKFLDEASDVETKATYMAYKKRRNTFFKGSDSDTSK